MYGVGLTDRLTVGLRALDGGVMVQDGLVFEYWCLSLTEFALVVTSIFS